MKITFLGTGTSVGVPMIGCQCAVCQSVDLHDKRLRSSILWQVGETKLLIDAGPDFRQQMLRAQCKTIDAILITHHHYDHIGGLDDVRSINYWTRKPMPIYAEEHTISALHKMLSYVFAKNKYPGVPKMELKKIDEQPFTINNIVVTPIRVMHYKMPILGFRIANWIYITDASQVPDESIELMKGCDTLIINALRWQPHLSHFNVSDALEVVEKVNPKRTFLTHICHDMGLHAEAQLKLPKDVYLAYDGLIIED